METKSATAIPLKQRLAGKVFLFSGKWSYPPPERISELITSCGGAVAPEAGPDVNHVISNSVTTQTTQKLVAQLTKKNGVAVGLTDVMDIESLLQLTGDDMIALLQAGDSKLWNYFTGHLKHKVKLAVVDLKAMDLSAFNLALCDLKGADLSGCSMNMYQFREVNGAKLDGAKFAKSTLGQLRSCSLKNASLSECIISESMSDCDFSSANLAGATAYDTKFSKCDFSDSDLSSAQLDRAEFKDCRFSKTNLTKASLVTADLRGADLSNCSLAGAVLYETKLDKAKLAGVDFRNAFLCNASFKGADLVGADFTGAATRGADFSGAQMKGVIGLTENKAKKTPTGSANLKRLEEIAKKVPRFFSSIEVELNGVRVKLYVTYFTKQGFVYGSININGAGSPSVEYDSISAAMIALGQTFPDATLDVDSVHVSSPPKTKIDCGKLALAAWCEALGDEVPTDDELKKLQDEKASKAKVLLDELVSELKGGYHGIAKWNARRQNQEEIPEISGHDFSNVDFTGAILDDVRFPNCKFDGAVLKQVSMRSANCYECSFVGADLEQVVANRALFEKCDLTGARMCGAQIRSCWANDANFSDADLTDCDFGDAFIQGSDLATAKLSNTKFQHTSFNQDTKFPPDFKPVGDLLWVGKGVNPFIVQEAKRQTSGDMDFDFFLDALQKDFDKDRMKKVLKMLQADRFKLFADVSEQAVVGIVKSQTDPDLLYSCRLGSDGSFACCTQNTNSCGGLRGALCKHILVLIVALAKSDQVASNKALEWILLSKAHQPKLDKSLMAETFLRYKGSEAGEIDWRPMETVPEDYYAF